MKIFSKSFTQQEPLPLQSIERATKVMQSGRLHRYNTVGDELSEVDSLEVEFAHYQGAKYCLACSSGGYAINIALRALGVVAEDEVLSNAFTLAPVPGAIDNVGAVPVFVEVDETYCIDLNDLDIKAQNSKAKVLLLSHMRGHIADMARIKELCQRHNLLLIEDCAHTMGASWDGIKSGSLADIACFSTQTYKHINSGEGGLLTSDNAQAMACAIMYSGSYMLYTKHQAAPEPSVFETINLTTPNYSGRMDNVRAAMLRPQLENLDAQCKEWNLRYQALEIELRKSMHIYLPTRPAAESFVGSSIQFSLPRFSEREILAVLEQSKYRGVMLKWFGDSVPQGYTSRYDSWRYLNPNDGLANTDRVLAGLLDMRIPLTFSVQDCHLLGSIIVEVVNQLAHQTS